MDNAEAILEFLGSMATVAVLGYYAIRLIRWLQGQYQQAETFLFLTRHQDCPCAMCRPHQWAEWPARVTPDRVKPRRYWAGKSEDEIIAELEARL